MMRKDSHKLNVYPAIGADSRKHFIFALTERKIMELQCDLPLMVNGRGISQSYSMHVD